jgi:hypothetical protein
MEKSEIEKLRTAETELRTELLHQTEMLSFIQTTQTDFSTASAAMDTTKARVLLIVSASQSPQSPQSPRLYGKALPLLATILSDFLNGTVSKLARFTGLDVHQQPKSVESKGTLTAGDFLRRYFPSQPPFLYSLISNSFHALHFLLGYDEISQSLGESTIFMKETSNVAPKMLSLLQSKN